jgi:thiol-disulfide isomerase/thioredoxin
MKKRSRYQSRYRKDKEPGDSIYTYLSGHFTSADLKAINQVTGGINKALPDLPPDFQKLLQEIADMNPEEFKQYMLRFMNYRLNEIRQKGYSANRLMMMENAIKIEVFSFMMQYKGLIFNAYLRKNNITTREEREKVTFRPQQPGAEYYSYLKGELNDYMSFLPNFVMPVELLSSDNVDFFTLPDGKHKPVKERLDYFIDKYASVMGTDKGIFFDMIQALYYGLQLVDMKYFNNSEKQEIRYIFRDKPVYAEVLITESDRIETAINSTKNKGESIKNVLPDVPQEEILEAILTKYKGKVVVADVWGTWCGPCLVAMRTIQPLKDEMKDKDVVFLYIADETSPLNDWTQTYPGISGEHYHVSRALTQYWGVEAYPTYMIFDKQGKQLAKYINFPGIDVMKKTIEKGL